METGSFARGAQAFYVTPQSISQQVKRLEHEVGCELLTRGNTGVEATPAGREFYAWCREALADAERVMGRCRELAGKSDARPIRLGISHDHTLSLYKHFAGAYMRGKGTRELEYVDLGSVEPVGLFVEALRNRSVDIIEWIDPQAADLGFLPLMRTRRCCLMSPKNPLSRREAVCAQDLVGQRVYVYSTPWTRNLRAWLDAHGLTAVQLVEAGAPDAPALLRSYLADNAIYLLPEQLSTLYENLANVPLDIDVRTEYGLAYLKECEGALADLLACAREAFAKAG